VEPLGPDEQQLDRRALRDYVVARRAQGRTLVLTNGCFDVLHLGHVRYLQQARQLGDLLIVGVNSDASMRALKGPDRPVNPETDRAAVLAALSCVDLVVRFTELTPHRLIEAVEPDVYVKGGDYTAETLPERDLVHSLGGRVAVLDHLPGRSTSAVIARIRADASI
jgi:D-beta-D-heptose 7-phosphate kinase/D-beta-D-heptose 1-phosphate adenosyltransferase